MTSGQMAALHIQALIFDGTLLPGRRVPQDEIAEALGISRIPLREALIALEREGWVTIEIHRGAFVNAFDESDLRDHYGMLGTVYGFAARRALERGSPSLPDVLDDLQEQLAREPAPGRAGVILRRFHLAVIDAARSPRTKVLLRSIPSLIPGDIFTTLPVVVDIERRAVAEIATVLRARDADAAADAYLAMMVAVGEEVATLFGDRQLFRAPEGERSSAGLAGTPR